MIEKRRSYNENKVATIVGPGTSFSGEVHSQGTIRIEGSLKGRIQCDDTIVVHETGKVKADLIAGQVIISGLVEGDVFAHDRIEVTSGGKILGNITAPRVSIAEGVVFEGKCSMKAPGEAQPPVAASSVVASPDSASPVLEFPKAANEKK